MITDIFGICGLIYSTIACPAYRVQVALNGAKVHRFSDLAANKNAVLEIEDGRSLRGCNNIYVRNVRLAARKFQNCK